MIAAMAVSMPVEMPRLKGPSERENTGSLQQSSELGVVKFKGGIVNPKPSVGRLTVGMGKHISGRSGRRNAHQCGLDGG
jgi:hypothetical protein